MIIFSGLPGVGKTELSKALSNRSGAIYLRIDGIIANKSRKECIDELKANLDAVPAL